MQLVSPLDRPAVAQSLQTLRASHTPGASHWAKHKTMKWVPKGINSYVLKIPTARYQGHAQTTNICEVLRHATKVTTGIQLSLRDAILI